MSFTKKGSYSFTITCKDDKGVETKKTATVTVAKEEESKGSKIVFTHTPTSGKYAKDEKIKITITEKPTALKEEGC